MDLALEKWCKKKDTQLITHVIKIKNDGTRLILTFPCVFHAHLLLVDTKMSSPGSLTPFIRQAMNLNLMLFSSVLTPTIFYNICFLFLCCLPVALENLEIDSYQPWCWWNHQPWPTSVQLRPSSCCLILGIDLVANVDLKNSGRFCSPFKSIYF